MPDALQMPDWKSRLEQEVHKLQRSPSYRELTYNRLKALVNAPNERLFMQAVAEKISSGQLGVFYRVISPRSKASIGNFSSPLDVPETIMDHSIGDMIEVDPFRNVEAVYIAETARAQ